MDEGLYEVSKFIASDKGYFALNSSLYNNVVFWDRTGKYNFTIDYKFYPEEWFQGLSDIYFDEVADDLYMLNTTRKEILMFNINSHEKRIINLPFEYFKFTKFKGVWFFYSGNRIYNPSKPSRLFNVLTSEDLSNFKENISFSTDFLEFVYDEYNNFILGEDEIIFSQFLNDTIYKFSNNEFKPHYIMNFGSKAIPKDKLIRWIKNPQEFGRILNNQEHIPGYNVVFNSTDLLIVTFAYERKPAYLFFYKGSGNYFWTTRFANTKYGIPLNGAYDTNRNGIYYLIDNENAQRSLMGIKDNLIKNKNIKNTKNIKNIDILSERIGDSNFVVLRGKI